ncbi:MAG: hypothetical protein WA981_07325 [Glaciecola sp.]
MINTKTIQALHMWDEPRMYTSISLYMQVSELLVLLAYEGASLNNLSSDQLILLENLVAKSLEATITVFEKADDTEKEEVIDILEALSQFALELRSLSKAVIKQRHIEI